MEKKKGVHLFDRMYLFEDINFSTQDEDEKEETGAKFEMLLRAMNVSCKIIVSNHYADNNRLRESIGLSTLFRVCETLDLLTNSFSESLFMLSLPERNKKTGISGLLTPLLPVF